VGAEDAVIEELRLGAITAIDGLWFLAVEEALGFEKAFELDLEVWSRYGIVLLKRLAKRLGVNLDREDPPPLKTVSDMLVTLCTIDGTESAGEMQDADTCVFRVFRCPWWDNLQAAGRSEVVDNTMFRRWLDAVDPAIGMEITRSKPRGDAHCEWVLRRPVSK